MTRRERLESRLEKRAEWAESRRKKAKASFSRAEQLTDGIPFGQPILVGHHSEKRHRRTIDKAWNAGMKGVEHNKMAEHHDAKASNLEDHLERTIFSDDEDAVQMLQAKISELGAERDRMKRVNALYRKAKKPAVEDDDGWARFAELLESEDLGGANLAGSCRRMMQRAPWEKSPYASYQLSNLGGRISQAKKRIADIELRNERAREAEASEAGVVVAKSEANNYAQVTFAEKPERDILQALRDAGYVWSRGSWFGKLDRLPAEVSALS